MTAISDLIARVEAGEVSRDLDAAICCALDHFPLTKAMAVVPLTSSLDAAYALKEAVLPGWASGSRVGRDWSNCYVRGSDGRTKEGAAPTHAAALVAAILRAWEGMR